jgi:hypothetical protein
VSIVRKYFSPIAIIEYTDETLSQLMKLRK